MQSVIEFANAGGPVLGMCNGFQILCESGLLPGALVQNRSLSYICEWTRIRVETARTRFTAGCSAGRFCGCRLSMAKGAMWQTTQRSKS